MIKIMTIGYNSESFRKAINGWIKHIRSYCKFPIEIVSDEFEYVRSEKDITVIKMETGKKEYAPWYGDEYIWDRILNNVRNKEICFKIDLDVFLKKDITPLSELPYDLIFTYVYWTEEEKEFLYNKEMGYPCTGFAIFKEKSYKFCEEVLADMRKRKERFEKQESDSSLTIKEYLDKHGTICIAGDQIPSSIILERLAKAGRWRNKKIMLGDMEIEVSEYDYDINDCKICVLPRIIIDRSEKLDVSVFGNHKQPILKWHYE